ncbi:MAG: 4-amino-4-deoxy-L-arabinose transferase, partial [Bacteroidota bacterium]
DAEPVELKIKDQSLKVYNPYNKDIPLHKLKFNVAYLDRYKDIIEIGSVNLKLVDPKNRFLKAKDTTRFNLSFPEPKKEYPRFLKFSISENGLASGINSASIKVKP